MSHKSNEPIWGVPVAGFRWVWAVPIKGRQGWPKGGKPRWYLVANEREQRFYNPSEQPDLFRVFAGTEPDRDHIRDFAMRYGPLGLRGPNTKIDVVGGSNRDRQIMVGESLESWANIINMMKELIHLWNLCEQNATKKLARFIRWSDDGSFVDYTGQPVGKTALQDGRLPVRITGRAHISPTGSAATVLQVERLTPNDVLLPALFLLQTEVNRNLESGATAHLVWDLDGTLRVHNRPTSLLGMLWLQFAEAISGRMVYHSCPTCLRWVRLTPGVAGPSRVYCSNACKMKALRWRQEEARRRHAAGESLTSIAAVLGSDENTVTAWVTGTRHDRLDETSRKRGTGRQPVGE
jgi:hypothetical protein